MNTKWIGLMAVAGVVLCGAVDAQAQKQSAGWFGSSRSGCSGAFLSSSPSTYKVGSTTYVSGQYYESGYPKVQRSSAVRSEFLSQRGYSSTPAGYQVDHIVLLSHGGADATYNMQLLPTSVHKAKTAQERAW